MLVMRIATSSATVLFALWVSGCASTASPRLTNRGLPGEVTDPARYEEIIAEFDDHPALQHFPASVPANSSFVRLHFHPALFQGGSVLQLKVSLPPDEVQSLYSVFARQALYVIPSNTMNDPLFEDPEIPRHRDLTADTESTSLREGFELLVLGAEDLGSKDAPWNHGVTYGVAVDRASSQVVYWYEDW